MIWRRIFGFIPVPVFYTDRLPDGVGGRAIGPLVQIRPKYRDRSDEGLHQHELDHVKQFWRLWLAAFVALVPAAYFMGAMAMIGAWAFGAHWDVQAAICAAAVAALAHPLLYLLARRYRLYAEAHAYATQTKYLSGLGGTMEVSTAAFALTHERYRLGLTLEQARAEIERQL